MVRSGARPVYLGDWLVASCSAVVQLSTALARPVVLDPAASERCQGGVVRDSRARDPCIYAQRTVGIGSLRRRALSRCAPQPVRAISMSTAAVPFRLASESADVPGPVIAPLVLDFVAFRAHGLACSRIGSPASAALCQRTAKRMTAGGGYPLLGPTSPSFVADRRPSSSGLAHDGRLHRCPRRRRSFSSPCFAIPASLRDHSDDRGGLTLGHPS